MFAGRDFDRCVPLTWIGTFPVYLATVFAGGLLLAMVATAVAMGTGATGALAALSFDPFAAVRGGEVWRFATYLLVNPPSFWTLIQILLLGMFGREVEKHLGRGGFLGLFVSLALAMPLLHAALAFAGLPEILAGSSLPSFGVFLAFVLLYPRAEIFFGLQARWIAIALLGINSLMAVAARDLAGVAGLWWALAVAWLYLGWKGAVAFPKLPAVPGLGRFQRRRHTERQRPPVEDLHGSIDPILEKISRSGFSSLTRSERLRLDRARAALLEQESRKP